MHSFHREALQRLFFVGGAAPQRLLPSFSGVVNFHQATFPEIVNMAYTVAILLSVDNIFSG